MCIYYPSGLLYLLSSFVSGGVFWFHKKNSLIALSQWFMVRFFLLFFSRCSSWIQDYVSSWCTIVVRSTGRRWWFEEMYMQRASMP
ncbi:hypothetical protein P167DRAFT_146635 [Morchella conica CCBAS932]|uniref:Uncharacterized protein n=1 Tax=Morchella conica CCBAS932 TaxID=1392247 RepID=A0A3N4KUB0_9PEZI|nr:hypothetical protein P167DRAFT_146635 [Morchella conica CCBAS932]